MTPPAMHDEDQTTIDNMTMTFRDCDKRMGNCSMERERISAAGRKFDKILPTILGIFATVMTMLFGWGIKMSNDTAVMNSTITRNSTTLQTHDQAIIALRETVAGIPEKVRSIVREELDRVDFEPTAGVTGH